MVRLRSSLILSFILLVSGATPLSAQNVAEIVDNMRSRYEQQLETVDTYIVETNLYTAYTRKVEQDGQASYETQTQLKGQEAMPVATGTTPSSAYGLRFERMAESARYTGTESIDGVRCYVLQIDDPAEIDPDMGEGVESMTYYVDAAEYVPVRMVMRQTAGPSSPKGSQGQSVTVNMKSYETVDGLTLPRRMEIQVQTNMTDEQRKQMEQAIAQLDKLPEAQRKQMEKMMGSQMDMMRQMLSGEAVVIEVQSVQVNVDIPEGIF